MRGTKLKRQVDKNSKNFTQKYCFSPSSPTQRISQSAKENVATKKRALKILAEKVWQIVIKCVKENPVCACSQSARSEDFFSLGLKPEGGVYAHKICARKIGGWKYPRILGFNSQIQSSDSNLVRPLAQKRPRKYSNIMNAKHLYTTVIA